MRIQNENVAVLDDCHFLCESTRTIELPNPREIDLDVFDKCEYLVLDNGQHQQMFKVHTSPRASIQRRKRWWYLLRARVVLLRADVTFVVNICDKNPDERIRELSKQTDFLDYFLGNVEVLALVHNLGGETFLDRCMFNYGPTPLEIYQDYRRAAVWLR